MTAFLELLGRFELPKCTLLRNIHFVPVPLGFASLKEVGSSKQAEQLQKSSHPFGMTAFLELLGRFELPTSSLPRMRSTY